MFQVSSFKFQPLAILSLSVCSFVNYQLQVSENFSSNNQQMTSTLGYKNRLL